MESTQRIKMGEKIGYGLGDLACNLIFQTVSIFLLFFYTDIFGISPAAASTMFLVARLWDAVNDPIMGGIVDKTKTRWGKFRPYLLWGAIPFAIMAILCFTTPDLGNTGKLIYAYVTYIGLGMVYTFVNVPYGALTSSITQNPSERASLSAIRMFFAIAGGLLVAVGIPELSKILGGENVAKGYQYSMTIFGILGAVLLFITFFTTKERHTVQSDTSKINFKNVIRLLKENRPLQIICLVFVILFGNNTITGAMGIYYFNYKIGQPDLLSMYLMLSMLTMLIVLLFVPMLLKKFEKKQILIAGMLISLIKPLALYSTSVNVIMVGNVLGSIGFGLAVGIIWGLVPDTIEYGELKTGIRAEGIIYAVVGFFFKVGMALGGLVPGFVLDATGYVPDAIQTESALRGIQTLISTIPIGLSIISVIILIFYKLDSKTYNKIIEELKKRNA